MLNVHLRNRKRLTLAVAAVAIPTGADPQAYLKAAAESEGGPPQTGGGPPHFVNGMFGEIAVEG